MNFAASDLAYNGVDATIAEIEGPISASLKLEPVEFTAKNGPRKGQFVSYTKPVLTINGPASVAG